MKFICVFGFKVQALRRFLVFSEYVSETFPTRVQGGICEEVPFHPAALQPLQGLVGLANSPGDLLRGRHRALQRLLRQSKRGERPPFTCQPQHHMERRSSGDALHARYHKSTFWHYRPSTLKLRSRFGQTVK